ncbi:2'-5' RNA ligase family protein [Nitrosomonas sp.]|uniref:2'-5' RNA ligase family protein n=1 Tax=Nitrosomonas sp. TaxID=42353 RepID=UPI00374C8B18
MYHTDTWQSFIQQQHTHAAEKREYPEWHKNRPRYYLWAIDSDTVLVNNRLKKYHPLFKDLLLHPYERQAHITLAISGFLSEHIIHNDDITQAAITKQQAALHTLKLAPFIVSIGGINSFSSAPFLEVMDPSGSLEVIRHTLINDRQDFRNTHYIPHVTLGIYNANHAIASITAMIIDLKEEPIELPVNHIGLFSYDARDIGSRLKKEYIMTLY